MYKVGLLIIGALAGALCTVLSDRALTASAHTVAPAPHARTVAPWHVYDGARECHGTGADTVACDNGYRGPRV